MIVNLIRPQQAIKLMLKLPTIVEQKFYSLFCFITSTLLLPYI